MTIELVKILEAAKEAYKHSMYYFDLSENDPCEEMRSVYWARCEEYEGECKGLLKAYEILTGKKIVSHGFAIDEELALA